LMQRPMLRADTQICHGQVLEQVRSRHQRELRKAKF